MAGKKPPGRRELWLLIALSAMLVFAASYFTLVGQQAMSRNATSTFNARPKGVKALYLLLDQLGYRTDRLATDFTALSNGNGLLVVIEPFQRERRVTNVEVTALKRWTERGGTTLWFVTEPARPLDPSDPLGGDLEIVRGDTAPQTVAPGSASPLMQGIHTITAQSPVRLKPAPHAPYQTLFQDGKGVALVAMKPVGKGRLIVAANSDFTSNARIAQADNALFVVNVAALATENGKRSVLFDEYHHGVGFDSPGSDEGGQALAFPLPLKLVLGNLGALALVLLFNSNRRYGGPRALPETASRASADYIRAMAKLHRRAGAADIALESLYCRFRRSLTHSLDLPADIATPLLAKQAALGLARTAEALESLFARCDRVVAGERLAEPELLHLVHELERLQPTSDRESFRR